MVRFGLTATVEHDNVIHLRPSQEYPEDLVLGKFIKTKWKGNRDEKNYYAKKCFRQNCKKYNALYLATAKNIGHKRWLAPNLIASKPHVNRGTTCDSINDGYAIISMRPERLTSENGV